MFTGGGHVEQQCPLNKNGRNGKIEFWRFIFSVIIVIHHSRSLLGDENCKFLGGSFAVEFFFLVSGYLMMQSIERTTIGPSSTNGIGKETLLFLWKKVKSVYPGVLIAWIIALVFVSFARNKSLLGFVTLAIDSFFEVTVLKMSGLHSISLNGVTWYISSMLLSMAILYPLIRKYPDIMKYIGVPLIVLLSLGYLGGNFGGPRDPLGWVGFTKKGNLRALGELSLGVICYGGAFKLSQIRFSRLGKICIALAEWCFYIIVILFMYYMKSSGRDFFFLLIMALAVMLSFSHQGADASFFDRPFFAWLGKYSFFLYLGHTYYAQNLNYILPVTFSGNQRMFVYLVCAVGTSFVIWTVSNVVKVIHPKVVRLAKLLFLVSVDL